MHVLYEIVNYLIENKENSVNINPWNVLVMEGF